MFCQYCGRQLSDAAAFCPGCGQPTGRNAQPRQPAAQQYQPYVRQQFGQQPQQQQYQQPQQRQQQYQQPQQQYQQPPQQQYQPPRQQYQQQQPRQQYNQPVRQQSAGQAAAAPAAAAAKKGTGLGVKLVVAGLVGATAFFGGKALIEELGGSPPTETKPPYTQNYNPGGNSNNPGGNGSNNNPGGNSNNNNPGGNSGSNSGGNNAYNPSTGSYEGLSGVGQQKVGGGAAIGMTTEQAASNEIFFVLQDFTYSSESFDAEYNSTFVILKVDPDSGTAWVMESVDGQDDATPLRYDPVTGTITLAAEEDGARANATLTRNPDGTYSGSMTATDEGETAHAYMTLRRITPTSGGRWLSLDTGEVFDENDLDDLEDTKLGEIFLNEAAAYGAAHGYSMQTHSSSNSSQTTSSYYVPPMNNNAPVELSDELIDYYVMVEGQNRIRAKYGAAESHVTLPKNTSITEEEFNRRVEEYVRAWGPQK